MCHDRGNEIMRSFPETAALVESLDGGHRLPRSANAGMASRRRGSRRPGRPANVNQKEEG